MNHDLLPTRACIDWASAQLPILEARIESWRESAPYKLFEELHPHNGEKVYKLTRVQQLPAIVNVETGVIINSLRSSLDVLTNILAERNGFPNPKHTQFPVCRIRDDFLHGPRAGRKEIKLLSAADQKIIEDLEPWPGGHAHLFDLHTLDITRKHKRLIEAYVMPAQWTLGNVDRRSGFRFSGIWKGFENDAIIGWAKIDAPRPDIDISLEVTLAEGSTFPSKPVLAVLHEFTRATTAIIDLFDR